MRTTRPGSQIGDVPYDIYKIDEYLIYNPRRDCDLWLVHLPEYNKI